MKYCMMKTRDNSTIKVVKMALKDLKGDKDIYRKDQMQERMLLSL